jgi:hypothetical protein
VKGLKDAVLCLDEAVAFGEDKDSKRTKYWAAAASEARFALEKAKETAEWYAPE